MEPTIGMAQPVVQALTVRGFRSIRHEHLVFTNPTVLIGRNAAGKSNLVDALAFLADLMVSPLEVALASRGGYETVAFRRSSGGHPVNLGLSVEVAWPHPLPGTGAYTFELRATRHGFEVKQEDCVLVFGDQHVALRRASTTAATITSTVAGQSDTRTHQVAGDHLMLPSVVGLAGFNALYNVLQGIRLYDLDTRRLREPQPADAGYLLRPDGANLASVVRQLSRRAPEVVEKVNSLLGALLGEPVAVTMQRRGKQDSLRLELGQPSPVRLSSDMVSEGTLRVLGLLVAVLQPQPPAVVVIEEPETCIHPGGLGVVIDALKVAAERTQVILTSHSPELLEAEWLTPDRLRLVTLQDRQTRIADVAAWTAATMREHLLTAGELLRSGGLDAAPLAEPAEVERQWPLWGA